MKGWWIKSSAGDSVPPTDRLSTLLTLPLLLNIAKARCTGFKDNKVNKIFLF